MAFPRVLTRDQVRRFDKLAIDEFEMPSLVLMENAARAATDRLCQESFGQSAVVLCGPGNNGGDGLVIARHLHLRDWRVKVLLLASPDDLSPDATVNYRILSKTRVPIRPLSESIVDSVEKELSGFDWCLDALLGTGAKPPLREPMATVVEQANRFPGRRMAVDIPSGLDCDGGEEIPEGPIFRAHLTTTFVAQKPVMTTATGQTYCGEITIVDIGAPPEVYARIVEITTEAD